MVTTITQFPSIDFGSRLIGTIPPGAFLDGATCAPSSPVAAAPAAAPARAAGGFGLQPLAKTVTANRAIPHNNPLFDRTMLDILKCSIDCGAARGPLIGKRTARIRGVLENNPFNFRLYANFLWFAGEGCLGRSGVRWFKVHFSPRKMNVEPPDPDFHKGQDRDPQTVGD